MAAFTKLALCGHRQVVVCNDATAATCIQVAACAMCNPELSGSLAGNRYASPKLDAVPLFSDESLEIVCAVEIARKVHRQETASIDTDLESLTIIVPSGAATFCGFPVTSLHLSLLRLKIAGVAIVKLVQEKQTAKICVNASRYCVFSALSGKVAGIRFLLLAN